MNDVVVFMKDHARASSGLRAARPANVSAVTPAERAASVDRTRVHHSEGILSRRHHLITAQLPAPTSDAMASRDDQSSMTERKVGKSGMHNSMGQTVPKIKAIVSHDTVGGMGHSVPMAKHDDEIAESEWREAFRQRVREAQGNRTQEKMAKLLGISRDTYAKYVGARGSVMSPRLLLKFCDICDVSFEWLVEGPEVEASEKPVKTPARPPKIATRQ